MTFNLIAARLRNKKKPDDINERYIHTDRFHDLCNACESRCEKHIFFNYFLSIKFYIFLHARWYDSYRIINKKIVFSNPRKKNNYFS